MELTQQNKEVMQQKLLAWYDQNKRDLPWRKTKNPYYIWVSEIMLQQTRVEAVKDYYKRFITALPTINDLAKAEQDQLYKLWQGLGYYNRVKNIQQAANTILEEFAGEFPTTKQQLQNLKGIGDYTSSAIASIAFEEPVAVVDGNVLRVLARLFEIQEDITKQSTKSNVSLLAQQLLSKQRPGDFNQAMMELGATVCVPNGVPSCEKCPFQEFCLANKHATELQLPIKKAKKQRKIQYKTILTIQIENEFLLHKRTEEKLLAGLWEFVNLEGALSSQKTKEHLSNLGFEVKSISKLAHAKHIFTHIEWHMIGYHVVVLNKPTLGNDYHYVTKEQLIQTYAVPNAFSTYLKELKNF